MATRKIVGTFKTEVQALDAVNELKACGYSSDEISVIAKDNDRTKVIEKETHVGGAGSGALGGAATGATIGAAGALLTTAGAILIPGIGPLLAAGPIATFLTGLIGGGAVGGVVGGLAGALTNTGVDEERARIVEDRFNEGDIVVLVDEKTDHYENACRILDQRI